MFILRSLIPCALTFLIAGAAVGQQKDQAYLKTKVDPTRAGVFVDGKYVGPAGRFGAARKYALAPRQARNQTGGAALRGCHYLGRVAGRQERRPSRRV